MPAFALPAFWAAIAAGSTAGAGIYAANKQSGAVKDSARMQVDAANHAADAQAKSTAEALAFEKEQAARDYGMQESNRHANYDQWAAGQHRLGTIGEMVGLGPREIPGYVPLPGSPTTGAPPPDLSTAKATFDKLFPGETLTPQMLAAHRAELEAAGFKLNPNAAGLITDLSYGGLNIDPIQGAGSGLNRKQWLVNPGGGGPQSARTPYRMGPVASYLDPSIAAPITNLALTPALTAPRPGRVGAYL